MMKLSHKIALIIMIPGENQRNHFFQIWNLKEKKNLIIALKYDTVLYYQINDDSTNEGRFYRKIKKCQFFIKALKLLRPKINFILKMSK